MVEPIPQPPPNAKRAEPVRRGTPLVCSLSATSASGSSRGDDDPGIRRVVHEISAALAEGARCVLLAGAPGTGKTRALRALILDRGPRTTFFTPFLHLTPREAAGWLGGLLAGDMSAESCHAGPLPGPTSADESRVVLIDEALSVPEATLRHVVRLIRRDAPDIQLVLATCDPAETARVLGSVSVAPVHVSMGRRASRPLPPPPASAEVGPAERPAAAPLRLVRSVPETPLVMPASAPPRRLRHPGATPAVALSLGVSALLVAGLWNARATDPLPAVGAAPTERPAAMLAQTTSSAAPVIGSTGPAPTALTIQVNAAPWAEIQLDGERIGATPLSLAGVTPGPHELVAIFPGGRVDRRIVEVSEDQRFFSFD